MKHSYKLTTILGLLALSSAASYGQLKTGSNPAAITANTNLEIEAANGNKVTISKDTGKVKIVDGSQGLDKVLTSDANGIATWRPVRLDSVMGNLSAAGAIVPCPSTEPIYTGSTITLPPGTWKVDASMVMRLAIGVMPADSSIWLRSSFSDSPTKLIATADFTDGKVYISGNYPSNSYWSVCSGSVFITNSTSANKSYYYYVHNMDPWGSVSISNSQIVGFGGSYGEDKLSAIRIGN